MKAQSKPERATKSAKMQSNQAKAGNTAEGSVQGQQANAETLLKADHRKVEGLFEKFKSATAPEQKSELVEQICNELQIHTKIEEEIFYPACREKGVTDSTLDEAQVEHDGAKVLINDLKMEEPDSGYYDAKVTVLSEYIKHHVGEEEKPSDGIFAKARATGVDMEALGNKILARKAELVARAGQGRLPPASLRSLHLGYSTAEASNKENDQMPRNRGYDDDDDRRGSNRGRGGMGYSRDDDDYRQGGRYGSQDRDEEGRFSGEGGNGGRYGSQNRERDEHGRFTSDDDDGGYRRRSSGDDHYRRGSSGGRSRDDDGRFTGEGGNGGRYGSQDRDRDEQGRFTGEGGHGGRYGSQDRDRDEQGRFTGEDNDDRGRSSRYRDDDDGRDGGGYGRSSGSRNYGRERDDEGRFTGGSQRGSHSGSQDRDRDDRGRYTGDDDDGRRSSRSSSSSSGSSSGRGGSRSGGSHEHGGWYGDSRAHSQAAKRGWQHRG